MVNLKEREGEKSATYREEVTESWLERFRMAVGARDRDSAPPTFLTVCRKGEFELFDGLGLVLSNVLHGEQEYVYLAPVTAGDTLNYESRLAQVLEKRGSRSSLQILTFETEVRVQAKGEGQEIPCATCKTTIIIRSRGETTEKARA